MTGLTRDLVGRVRRRLARSLKARMVAAFFTVSVLIGAVVSVESYRVAASALRTSSMDRMRGVAIRRESDVNRWVAQHVSFLQFVSVLPVVTKGVQQLSDSIPDTPAETRLWHERLRAILERTGGSLAVDEVFVLSRPGGRVIASTDSSRVGDFHVDDPYFTNGLRGPYIQNIYPSADGGRPTLTVSVPVPGSGGRAAGVLAAHLSLKRMDELLTQTNLGLSAHVYVVNRFGEIVSSERFGRSDYRRGVHSEGIARALAGQSGVGEYEDYRGESVLGAYRWIADRELALMVETPSAVAYGPARLLLFRVVLISFLGVVALTAAVYLVSRRVADPIVRTAHAAARLSAGDFDVLAPVTTSDEVGQLATAFNEMTARLRTVYGDLEGQVRATTSALEALRGNQALVEGIIDNSPTIVLVLDGDGRCVLVNRRFEDLSGFTRDHCRGRHITELLTPGTAAICLESGATVTRTGETMEREVTLTTIEGKRTFLAACFPISRGAPGQLLGFVATDLTDRKRAEEERRAFESNVQHAQKLESLGVMAGGIAHDFNNLLGAVLGNADLALKSLDRRDEVARSLEQVTVAARRASELTRQMLAYAGRASFRRDAVDLNALVREIATLAAMSFSKKVTLELQLCATTAHVLADSAQLSQVILNLLTNAGDAIGDAAGKIVVRTSVVAEPPEAIARELPAGSTQPGRYALLSVEDSGCGMDDATRRRIFEPFFTSKQMGRGLGLSAVRGIMKGVGGAIVVQSAPGEGTRFDLAFPASGAERAATPPVAPEAARPALAGTVLVVDDEQLLRYVTRRTLQSAGYRVLEAEDGHAALDVFRAHRDEITAVVLDYTMPGMNGEEVLNAIRQTDRHLGVVVASGYALQQDGHALREDPRVRLLQKPFDNDVLFRTLDELAS